MGASGRRVFLRRQRRLRLGELGMSHKLKSVWPRTRPSLATQDVALEMFSPRIDANVVPFNTGDSIYCFKAHTRPTDLLPAQPVTIEVGCDGIIVWWGHYSANGDVTGKMCCAFPLDEITAQHCCVSIP